VDWFIIKEIVWKLKYDVEVVHHIVTVELDIRVECAKGWFLMTMMSRKNL
jgi:hypothetical protein